ncbi:hypothetical protein MKX01_041472 [Papaver californicum]|nr:hypothetical protein MKX01_041472 [Papaver californicum]
MEAWKLASCALAARREDSGVSSSCLLSNTAKGSGSNPSIALTIPKLCANADLLIGYKCGDYTLP